MMNRVTFTFIALLGVTTLAAGQLWLQGKALFENQGTLLGITLIILSAVVLLFGLLSLGRIVYRTASAPNKSLEDNNHV